MPMFFVDKNIDYTIASDVLSFGTVSDIDAFYVKFNGAGLTGTPVSGLLSGDIFGANWNDADDNQHGIYLFINPTTKADSPFSGDAVLNLIDGGTSGSQLETAVLLDRVFEFPDEDTFISQDMGNPEKGAVIHEDLYYGLSKIKGYFKKSISFTAELQTAQKKRAFEIFREKYTHFYFLEDLFNLQELPRFYPALLEPELDSRYSLPLKTEGYNIDFSILER